MASEFAVIVVGVVFPVATPAVKVLNLIHDLCNEIQDGKGACIDLHNRLKTILDALEQMKKDHGKLPSDVVDPFVDTLTEYWQLLKTLSEMNVVERLLKHRKVRKTLESVNGAVDQLFKMLNLANAEFMMNWKQELNNDMEVQRRALEEVANSAAQIMDELHGIREQGDAIVMLKAEITKIDKGESELAAETQTAVKKACNSLVRNSKAAVEPVPEWFVAEAEITIVERPFGRGSFGAVHRGLFRGNAKVVVKMLLPGESGLDAIARKDFLSEVAIWSKFNHPHVIKMFGACHVSKRPFIVCDEAANGNLAEYLEANKSKMWKLLYEAATGLEYLHARKVVHGDLKLNNLLVDGELRALVADFGLSRVKDMSKSKSTTKLKDGDVVEGGLRWRAPECFEIKPVFASDVYAFGMCIIEAVTGEPPYGHLDDVSVRRNIESGVLPPQPNDVPDKVWNLVVAMTQKDRHERMAMDRVIAALKELSVEEFEDLNAAALMCTNAKCSQRTPAGSLVCYKCGTRVKQSVAKCVRDLEQKNAEALAAAQALYQWCSSDVASFLANATDDTEATRSQLLETARDFSDPTRALYAFGCVSVLKEHDFGVSNNDFDELRSLVDGNVLPSAFQLVEDLQTSDEAKQRRAAELMAVLVELNKLNQNAMIDCIAPLALVCRNASGDLRDTALLTLAIVTEGHDENLQELRKPDVISTVLDSCVESSGATQETALTLLVQLTDRAAVVTKCATPHHIRRLVLLLENGNNVVKLSVLNVLANVAEKAPQAARLVGRCGGLTSLMDILEFADDANLKLYAFKAIAELGGYPLNAATLLEYDAFSVLQQYLSQIPQAHMSDMLWSLSKLVGGSAELKKAIASKGKTIINKCVGLLASEDGEQQRRAALVLRELVAQPSAVEAIDACGGLEKLADVVHGRDSYAAQALIGSIHTLLKERGVQRTVPSQPEAEHDP